MIRGFSLIGFVFIVVCWIFHFCQPGHDIAWPIAESILWLVLIICNESDRIIEEIKKSKEGGK